MVSTGADRMKAVMDYLFNPKYDKEKELWNKLNEIESSNWKEAYSVLRQLYPVINDDLIYSTHPFGIYYEYIYKFLSPAEKDFLFLLKYVGCFNFYPLYFLNGFFIDFANPKLKIAIEIDGKKYHDKEKDLIRDTKIRSFGWKIYRIPAGFIYKNNPDDSCLDDIIEDDKYLYWSNFYSNYAEGFLRALMYWLYYKDPDDGFEVDELRFRIAVDSLKKYELV